MDGNKKLACLLLSALAIAGASRSAHAQYSTYTTSPYAAPSYAPPSATPPLQPLPADSAPWPAPIANTAPPPGPPAPARPIVYQEPIGPAYASAPPAAEVTIAQTTFGPFIESSWYTRVDYFHWNERIDGFDLVNEDGAITTLGYERRVGRERFRAELFGGSVQYDGFAQFDDGSMEPLTSHTNYLGIRAEYELLFEPEWLPRSNLFAGLGTRFWIRDLPDDMTAEGDIVAGYQETWWTIYPYFGIEKKRLLRNDVELYWSDRIGLTAVTYQHASISDRPLYPKPGIMTRAELGVRGPHWFLAAEIETMSWGESDVVQGWLQPASTMFTAGLQSGFTF